MNQRGGVSHPSGERDRAGLIGDSKKKNDGMKAIVKSRLRKHTSSFSHSPGITEPGRQEGFV